jgi:hypothetical protein
MRVLKAVSFLESHINNELIHTVVLWNPDRSCKVLCPEFPAAGLVEGKTREEATEKLAERVEALILEGTQSASWTLGAYALKPEPRRD